MSVALYMDEHVPRAVTVGLRRRGVDVLTVQDDGRRGADDRVVFDRALALGRALCTQDEDFLAEAARRQASGEVFAGVVFAAQEAITIGKFIDDLELIAKVYDPVDVENNVIYLPF